MCRTVRHGQQPVKLVLGGSSACCSCTVSPLSSALEHRCTMHILTLHRSELVEGPQRLHLMHQRGRARSRLA
jgi:hypothetical protein